MKRTHSASFAAISAALLVLVGMGLQTRPDSRAVFGENSAHASTRPRYGGTLRVQIGASLASLEPAQDDLNSPDYASKDRLAALVFERLVRLDDRAEPQPQLAVSWEHNANFTEWSFRLRPGVKFHDGLLLTPSHVAQSLNEAAVGRFSGESEPIWGARASRDGIVLRTTSPRPDLLYELAAWRCSILRNTQSGVIGTGPFRLADWQPGRSAVFVANEDYWGGRPYLDRIEVQMSRFAREQGIALVLGQADIVEIPPEAVRRSIQDGKRVWSSQPVDLLSLDFTGRGLTGRDLRLRRALALTVDRAAIQGVLLQKQGTPANSLLPQWLGGYSFLLASERDPERARQLAAEVGRLSGPIVLTYESGNPLYRAIAERIVLDAREAGLTVQALERPRNRLFEMADWALIRIHMARPTGRVGDESIAHSYPLSAAEFPDLLYAVDSAMAGDVVMIPLVHLPESFGLSARVRDWAPLPWGAWRLEDVWLDETTNANEAKP